MATLSYHVQRYISGSWQAWSNARILPGLTITTDFGGTAESPIAWGATKPPEATIIVRGIADELSTAYGNLPVRIQLARGGSLTTVFVGIVVGKDETVARDTDEVAYTCIGVGEIVRRTRAISPLFYRRPAATLTTATSIEDPANSGCRSGLINRACFLAGLRPIAQQASYPDAMGYYHCDHAIIAPEWSWLNGEDAYAECGELARSVGGVITQTPDGVLRFLSPLSPTVGAIAATLAEGASAGIAGALYYAKLQRKSRVTTAFGRVRVPWFFRSERDQDVVWQLPERVRVPARGESSAYASVGYVDLEFQTDYPIRAWDSVGPGDPLYLREATTDRMGVSDFSQWPVTPSRNLAEGRFCRFVVSELGAQRVVGRFEHDYAQPLHLDTLVIEGRPVVVAHEGEHVSGSSGLELSYRPNSYISAERHAQMLGDMLVAFHQVERAVVSADDVLFSPTVAAGVRVQLHNTRLGLSPAALHLVTKTRVTLGLGQIRMQVDMIPIGDLPQQSAIWVWGDTISSGPKGVMW